MDWIVKYWVEVLFGGITAAVGPMTEGDVSTMAALGASLGLDMTEV